MSNLFLDNMQEIIDREGTNMSVTENGAVGLETTGKPLLDFNFKLSSMRNWSDNRIISEFAVAYNSAPNLSIAWLFFSRDIRGGCGERRTFRIIMKYLSTQISAKMFMNLLKLVPEYGRWDDVVWLYDNVTKLSIRNKIADMIVKRFKKDFDDYLSNKPVTLLAKWMPSINTSSANTRRIARDLCVHAYMSPREYRKKLAALRKYIKVVECDMSANEWGNIKYEAVPSKAGLIYKDAFMTHDRERYEEYLDAVENGTSYINAGAIFPYEIVHKYQCGWDVRSFDETLEAKWKALPNKITGGNGVLVVVDGSGSMSARVGDGNLTAHDVANSIGLYFAERLHGSFRNSFITFGKNPQLVRLQEGNSLNENLRVINKYQDCSNTNIQATFELILRTAVQNHMKQEEMPASLLIISDMEFDDVRRSYDYGAVRSLDKNLFKYITQEFELAGYKLPRLVFWNVNSRTCTIPVSTNDLGVALVSGFSPNIADMVMSGKTDPWENLIDTLKSERYNPVWKVVMNH